MNSTFFEQIFLGNSIRQYALFFSVFILGFFFKRIVSLVLSRLIYKLFRGFAQNTNNEVFVALLLRPIELVIFIGVCYYAIHQLQYPLNEVFFHYTKVAGIAKAKIAVTYIQFIDWIFLVLIIASNFWIALRIVDFISHVLYARAQSLGNKSRIQLIPFGKELVKILIVFIGFFVLLGFVFQVNVITLITGLGIGGIAVALAAKESIENLIGSFTIFLDKPFTVGDLIKVDGIEGVVERVGFRSTFIRSVDKTLIIIPNRGMTDGVLENVTLRKSYRVKFKIGLLYDTEPAQLQKIIADIKSFLETHEGINSDCCVYFESFGDSAINIEILYFIIDVGFTSYIELKESINFKIIDIVKINGSGFAYPTQRQV